MEKAYSFRSVSIDEGFYWRLQRWARFANWFGHGLLRRAAVRLERMLGDHSSSSSSSSSSSISSSA
jgi:hypothetical protein